MGDVPSCAGSSLGVGEVFNPFADIPLDVKHHADALMEEVDAAALADRHTTCQAASEPTGFWGRNFQNRKGNVLKKGKNCAGHPGTIVLQPEIL